LGKVGMWILGYYDSIRHQDHQQDHQQGLHSKLHLRDQVHPGKGRFPSWPGSTL